MKILLIGASPRPKDSTSMYLLQALKQKLGENDVTLLRLAPPYDQAAENISHLLPECQAVVVAFPLYADGLPASLLGVLRLVENGLKRGESSCRVYALVNNGFYEAGQNAIAIDMVWQWCDKCGLKRGCALGVGAGEMVQTAPPGRGPSSNLGRALDRLAINILNGAEEGSDYYVEPNFPRCLYKLAAHVGFRIEARKNGLKARTLKRRAD